MQKFKVNGQSVPKTEWKQTNGQTDGGDCIASLGNAGLIGFLSPVDFDSLASLSTVTNGRQAKCPVVTQTTFRGFKDTVVTAHAGGNLGVATEASFQSMIESGISRGVSPEI